MQNFHSGPERLRSIFIGGCPRSGTTMLGSILGGSKGCIVTPESHFKQKILPTGGFLSGGALDRDIMLSKLKNNFRFKIWQVQIPDKSDMPKMLGPDDYRRFLYSLVTAYAENQGISKWNVWIDHTPQNLQNSEVLMQIFPKVRFIHLVRNPRAVAASLLPLIWGPNTAKEAALFWAQKVSFGLAVEQMHPDRCMRVYYEDIVCNPEETIREICNFCDIVFIDEMLDGTAFNVPSYTRSQHKAVGSRPDPQKLDFWKNKLDPWQVEAIEKNVEDLIILMGYEYLSSKEPQKRPLLKKIFSRFSSFISFNKKIRFHVKKKYYG